MIPYLGLAGDVTPRAACPVPLPPAAALGEGAAGAAHSLACLLGLALEQVSVPGYELWLQKGWRNITTSAVLLLER